jgi:hypothetical protein
MRNVAALTSLVIRSSSLERSRGFYESLGLHFTSEQHESGPLHFSTRLGGMLVELYPTTRPISPMRFGLSVAGAQLPLEELAHHGGTVLSASPDATVARVSDPDGHVVELTAAPPPSTGTPDWSVQAGHEAVSFYANDSVVDPDGSAAIALKISCNAYELNIWIRDAELPRLDSVPLTSWEAGAIKIGTSAGADVWWSSDDGRISIGVGHDDQTWDFGVGFSLSDYSRLRNAIDDELKERRR